VLESEFRRVNTDDSQAVRAICPIPRLEVRECPLTVNAPVRPEVDQHHLALQPHDRQRASVGRIQPAINPGKGRGATAVLEGGVGIGTRR
jgi:hypothetical protein